MKKSRLFFRFISLWLSLPFSWTGVTALVTRANFIIACDFFYADQQKETSFCWI